VLFFFQRRQNRTKYSKILAPPTAAVTIEKTAFAESFWRRSVGVFVAGPTPYQRAKYRAMGSTTESKTISDQKMKMDNFLVRNV
jgi:hypothetical protein